MSIKNRIVFSTAFFAISCSAQIHLGGTDAASKEGVNQSDQTAEGSTPNVQNQENASPSPVAQSSASANQTSNPYTTEATRPKEIAGSFLTDFICEFTSTDNIACSLYEYLDGQKTKVERSYVMQAEFKGVIQGKVQGELDQNFVMNFDLKPLFQNASTPSLECGQDLKISLLGTIDGQQTVPSLSLRKICSCPVRTVFAKGNNTPSFIDRFINFNPNAKVKLQKINYPSTSAVMAVSNMNVWLFKNGNKCYDNQINQGKTLSNFNCEADAIKLWIYSTGMTVGQSKDGDTVITVSVEDGFSCKDDGVTPSIFRL